MSDVVYFIQRHSDQAIKIGYSGQIQTRLYQHRKDHNGELTVLGFISGDYDVEWAIQQCFWKHRISGDWFNPCPELVQWIEGNAVPDLADLPHVPTLPKTIDGVMVWSKNRSYQYPYSVMFIAEGGDVATRWNNLTEVQRCELNMVVQKAIHDYIDNQWDKA